MNRHRIARSAIVIALALASTACSEQVEQAAAEARQSIEAATAQAGAAADSIAAARQRLHEGNLSLGGGELPKVEITPQGDWLVNGLPLPLTEAQRIAVLSFRSETLKAADAGMNLGQDGIALAGQAVSQAVAGLLIGTEATTAAVTAEAQKIQASAQDLCQQVERLTAAQAQLAAILPEFAPYARPIAASIDCGEAATGEAAAPAAPQ